MSQPDKIRVAVLYGGCSGEHEVSLLSAANVIQQIDRSRFDVVPIGIDKQGVWFSGDDVSLKELTATSKLRLADKEDHMLFNPASIGRHLQQVSHALLSKTNNSRRLFDVVFPVIHGPLCEDGTVQGLLELANVPYVGCGVLSSAIGMDKDVSKRLVKAADISVAPYEVIRWGQDLAQVADRVKKNLSFPVFVKPANTGSSIGINKVHCIDDLAAAIDNAFQYDTKVLVEQAIDAIELEVAVLESLTTGSDPIVSVVGEVRPRHEFYSYAAKYLDDEGAELLIPARISDELQGDVRKIAAKIFAVLECEGMTRVDLFLDRVTQKIYFNEMNTIPGFTQISMYPKMMAASGVNYSALLTHLIMLAMARHERKSRISREYVAEV